VTLDEALTVVPDMADNFRVSSDGLTYLFRLREGARWSDGTPLTADDFVFAWRRMREEERTTAFLLADVEEAQALDDRTLEIRIREPRSYFLYLLAEAWAFPWPRHRCEALGDDCWRPENLVCNGPFALREYDDDHAVLVANPYWQGPRGNVREIRMSFVTAELEALEAWLAGRFDVGRAYDERALEGRDTIATTVPNLSMHYVGFRVDEPPFCHELVRKAFSRAVDRTQLAPAFGIAHPATRGGALPPAMPGHSHRAGPEFDLELARQLLAEAGYPDGKGLPEVELVVPEWLTRPEVLVDQWARLGARVGVRSASKHMCGPDLQGSQLWLSGWTADFPDPEGFFLGLLSRGDWPFYRDDEILELLERARSLRDQAERMHLYHEIDRLWVRERGALLPLSYNRTLLLRRPWVESVSISRLGRASFDQAVVSRPDSAPRPA
jgi:oligopeptide transport system substrate-binding protein